MPCPFCGSVDLGFQEGGDGVNEVYSYTVVCHGEDCLTSEYGSLCLVTSIEDAIKAWNTRATPSLEAIIEKIEAEKKKDEPITSYMKVDIHNAALDKAISIIREEGGI